MHQSKFSLQRSPGGPPSPSLHPLLLLKDFLIISLAASISIPGAIFETSPISAGNTLFPVSGRAYVTWFRRVGYLHFPYHETPEKKQLKERRACFGSRFEEVQSVPERAVEARVEDTAHTALAGRKLTVKGSWAEL